MGGGGNPPYSALPRPFRSLPQEEMGPALTGSGFFLCDMSSLKKAGRFLSSLPSTNFLEDPCLLVRRLYGFVTSTLNSFLQLHFRPYPLLRLLKARSLGCQPLLLAGR